MRVIVTGGAGFIGSAVVRRLVSQGAEVLNVDKLTYAGDPRSVQSCEGAANYQFLRADIADAPAITHAFAEFRPDAIVHLAAETHVDRSIDGPAEFLHTNVIGTYVLLEAALNFFRSTHPGPDFRFVLVSTDEVYGSLGREGCFSETSPYAPNSPYSASKASADHLARAWHKTFGLPVIVTNCSNNYGPHQNPEKLIPTIVRNALRGDRIPIYGTGTNIRDWLYVEDHVQGLLDVLARGRPGEKYNFGGSAELSNIDLAHRICAMLDERAPRPDRRPYARQIGFVADRPGHDLRYAIDPAKAQRELGWRCTETIETGLGKTIDWYVEHRDWLELAPDAGRLGLERIGMAGR